MKVNNCFRFAATLLFFIMFLSVCIFARNVDVFVCDEKISYNEDSGIPFVDENNRTLVPLRLTMESIGAEVIWDAETKNAIIIKENINVRCKVGEKCIYVNGVRVENDAAAVIKDGRIYLPIRIVLEAFNINVFWDGSVRLYDVFDREYVNNLENTPSVTADYWRVWTEALADKENGTYDVAIYKMTSIANVFIGSNSSSSNAMFYKNLGECYANIKFYDNASICFQREAFYWSITEGMEQARIDAERRAKLILPYGEIYAVTNGEDYDTKKFFGERFELRSGIYLGAYAEGDSKIYDPYYPIPFYTESYPELIDHDVAGFILYLPYGTELSHYNSHYVHAINENKIIQLCLEPHNGMSEVTDDDGYLVKLAKDMEKSECRFMLRFACEMNDPTSKWYERKPEKYIEKFRMVADIFHEYAPSVPVIWSPNFYPEDKIDDYYPGDEYVDYVGISSYQDYRPSTDPLNAGIDRSRWSNQLDRIYALYGYKKPIIISESGVYYEDPETGEDMTSFAISQMRDFYNYLPIKYPNVKMCFLFASDSVNKKYSLSGNRSYLAEYRWVLEENEAYVGEYGERVYTDSYYRLGNNVVVDSSEVTKICGYFYSPVASVENVNYYINDEKVATSDSGVFEVEIDFSEYVGEEIVVSVRGFSINYSLLVTETFVVKVV